MVFPLLNIRHPDTTMLHCDVELSRVCITVCMPYLVHKFHLEFLKCTVSALAVITNITMYEKGKVH